MNGEVLQIMVAHRSCIESMRRRVFARRNVVNSVSMAPVVLG